MKSARGYSSSAIKISVLGSDFDDHGIALILHNRPLTILVPSHVIVAIEDGTALSVVLDGEELSLDQFRVLKSSVLSREQLAAIRVNRSKQRRFSRISLPKHPIELNIGDTVSMQTQRCSENLHQSGIVKSIESRGEDSSIICSIHTSSGDSGSALLRNEKLAGVFLGRYPGHEGASRSAGLGIAIPIGIDALAEMRRLRRSSSLFALAKGGGFALVTAALILASLAYSWASFRVASVEISDDKTAITVSNEKKITLHQHWEKSFDGSVRHAIPISSQRGKSERDLIAVGTFFSSGVNGAVTLLDRLGNTLWEYSVPDGECIYNTQDESFNGFSVARLSSFDFTQDGSAELIVAFVHHTWYPCKLMVFSQGGEILAEYWHDGYIRTLFGALVPGRDQPMLIVSASNNRLNEAVSWHVQTIFAFEWPYISGQCPPYNGQYDQGSELWYYQIENVDPSLIRAKCRTFELVDFDGDHAPEIRASLSDGRFYYLDAFGAVRGTQLGDTFLSDFGNVEPPPLSPVSLRDAPSATGGQGGADENSRMSASELLYPIAVTQDGCGVMAETLVVDAFSPSSFGSDVSWSIYTDCTVQESSVSTPKEGPGGLQLGAQSVIKPLYAEMRFSETFDASEYKGIECVIRSEGTCEVSIDVLCLDSPLGDDCLDAKTLICSIARKTLPISAGVQQYRIPFYSYVRSYDLTASSNQALEHTLIRESIIGARITPDCSKHSITIERVGFYKDP